MAPHRHPGDLGPGSIDEWDADSTASLLDRNEALGKSSTTFTHGTPAQPTIVRFWGRISTRLGQFWGTYPSNPSADGLFKINGRGAHARDGYKELDTDARAADARESRRYLHLQDQDRDQAAGGFQDQPPTRRRRKLAIMGIGGIVVLAAFGGMIHSGRAASIGCKADASCNDISRLWGQYSPEFSVPSEIDASVPSGCTTSFALILARHGARYPTAKKTLAYNQTITRIQNSATKYGKGYEWLQDYVYDLGADDLTEFGQNEMSDAGKAFYKRYQKLAKKSEPFIRTSGSDRVIMSSYNFTQGYYGDKKAEAVNQISNILIIPEEEGVNNTMNHANCAAFEDGWASELGDESTDAWMGVFVPSITERLNKNLPGVNLTDSETIYMMDLCPFNTVASSDGKTKSKFCDLFTRDEWESYNYYETLDKYYGYGNGNPLGPTQGVGYVNELIARLTRQPVIDHTSTNSTLDSSDKTFPLDRELYADFSHDNDMTAIFSAMGLFNATETLPTTKIVTATDAKGFSSAWIVPFAARMYVEKLECSGRKRQTEEYVRVLINDRVMSMDTCGGDKYGRCKLNKFVESLSFARGGGLWNECAV